MTKQTSNSACTLLECDLPIVLAGMGGVSRAELVAAVTKAGGFGFLGMVRESPDLIEQEVQRLRDAGCHNFGVNIIPAATDADLLEQQVAMCIELEVPVVSMFWDIFPDVIDRLRRAGIKIVWQTGSVDESVEAEQAGADLIIAQGVEAGGHVRGTLPLAQLLPQTIDSVSVPVLAAGGLSTGADLVTAWGLGAAGIVLGTALIAAEESYAHDYHKKRLIDSDGSDTILTTKFHINWPRGSAVRVLRGPITNGEYGDPFTPDRTKIGQQGQRPIYRFSTDSPLKSTDGDFVQMALYAGTGVGAVKSIQHAENIIRQIASEALSLVAAVDQTELDPQNSSSVCYLDELPGDYTNHLSEPELRAALSKITGLLRSATNTLQHKSPQMRKSGSPSFLPEAVTYARFIPLLRKHLDEETHDVDGASIGLNLPQMQTLICDELSATIPRLPDGPLRELLIRLRQHVESEMNSVVTAAVQDGKNQVPTEEQIERLVHEFYAKIRQHDRLGPIFANKLGDDWGPHLAKMVDFWSSIMLTSGRYSGTPMQKHLALKMVRPEDFRIWLELFEETALSIGGPTFAETFMDKANRVAASFQAAMFYNPADDLAKKGNAQIE